ncbi:MAG: T9SS type A sorting domain-containing protein, partial [Ignavibacteriaceae bacterium]
IIIHNKALQSESATFWLGGHAGGLSILGSKGVYVNNIIQYNEVNAVNSSYGAGVVFDYPPDDLYFRNNIVSHNTYSGAGYCYGGGFAIWDGSPTLENNLFEKNFATFGAGGWIGNAFSYAKIINNTIIKNYAELKGGAIYTKSAEPTVMNSILWENEAPDGSEIFVESGTINVTYSDVMGGWTGTGNTNMNPKLISNYSLLHHNSPCIDAGNPDALYFDPEDPFHTGYAMYPARGFVRNDMGAYGGPGAAQWYEFLEGDGFQVEQQGILSSSNEEVKIDNYPNPFNPQTTIQLKLPKDGFVSLKIYNVLGQEVATLVSENLTSGSYQYVWNASNFASGIYVYRLEANGLVMDKKMILLK